MKQLATTTLVLAALFGSRAHADARDEVIAAFDAALAQKAYHVTSVTEVRGKPYETRVAMQLPGSFHIKNADSETVVLPGGSWMRMNNEWMRLPVDMSKMVQNLTTEAMQNGERYVQDVQATGEETIDGCLSKGYRYVADGKFMGFKARSTVDLSVCQDNGLPIRLISTDAKGKNRTELRYDFVTPVSIRAPG